MPLRRTTIEAIDGVMQAGALLRIISYRETENAVALQRKILSERFTVECADLRGIIERQNCGRAPIDNTTCNRVSTLGLAIA